ncbi:hypothetical protein GCM10018773_62770 [Streptomyces candidus]|nr:hypothetical protein GCM10018773_62770 [Streptomyces candidus]
MLVTDLDGTLLGGEADQRRQLRDELTSHPEITVVFATGRSMPSVQRLLGDPLVPRPHWIIGDVGASVAEGEGFSADVALQEKLRGGWPGAARVRNALKGFTGLTYQHGVVQEGRCSFYLETRHLTEQLCLTVAALGCSWVHSDGRYFDVLPPGADKGAALVLLAAKRGWSRESLHGREPGCGVRGKGPRRRWDWRQQGIEPAP